MKHKIKQRVTIVREYQKGLRGLFYFHIDQTAGVRDKELTRILQS